jgi:hypothetical protein
MYTSSTDFLYGALNILNERNLGTCAIKDRRLKVMRYDCAPDRDRLDRIVYHVWILLEC